MRPIEFPGRGFRGFGVFARAGKRLASMPRLGAAAALLSGLLVSCLGGPEGNGAYFRLEADPALTGYSRVTIRLEDTLGNLKATLYDDTLPSLDRLSRLSAGPYRGGKARILILAYRGDRLVYREIRLYDGEIQQVISVDLFRNDTAAAPVPALPGKPAGQAPTLSSFPGDTAVSIRDSVPLPAEASDADADLAGYAWDCNGDGRPEDSSALSGSRSKIRFGRAFADTGVHVCILKVWDLQGRSAQGKVTVRVALDAPVADAGKDTTVAAETAILLHAKGDDGFGPIVTREWKIGSGEFKHVTQQETSITAPETPGDLVCVLRVTDADGLWGLDTLVVKVAYHSDATLADLRSNVGKWDPAFRKDKREYLLTLAWADSVLAFNPTVNERHAKATVSGQVSPATGSGAFPVPVGDTSFTILVTAQDGSTLQYSVTARREGGR